MKISIQIHLLYTTSEFLNDKVIINKEIFEYGEEEYSKLSLQEDRVSSILNDPIDEYEWYNEIQEKEQKEIIALASREGLRKEFILLDWLKRLDRILQILHNERSDLFVDGIYLNLSIYLEILDTSIEFEKILIGGWGELMKKYEGKLKITRFFLIGKNLVIKKNILELEVPSKVNLTEVIIKNIDISNIKIKGYAKLLKISGSTIDTLLWRPNSLIYDIKKDRANIAIANSLIGKMKLGVYEDTLAMLSSIRIIQSTITSFIQITGIKVLSRKEEVGGLKFENSNFNLSSSLSIHNADIGSFTLIKTYLDTLDVRNTLVYSVYLKESNIHKSYFSGIGGLGFYALIQKNNKPNSSEIKEYYRHFKHSHDEIGNKIEANKFYEKEMEYYRKSLWEERPRKWQKIIISWLNDLVSDYGINWWKAFKFYILFVFSIYIIHNLIKEHNGDIYNFIIKSWMFWHQNIIDILHLKWNNFQFNEFARYLNPFPDLKEDKTILGLIFSTLKILIVYQIVVALRRISQR